MRTRTLHILLGVSAALFVVSQVNIVLALGSIGPEFFALQTTLSADTFRDIVTGWSPEELTRYREHLAWDTVHPLLYGSLLLIWSLVVHRHGEVSEWRLPLLVTLSVLPSVLDYVENAIHIYLDVHRDAIDTLSVLAAGLAADLKWLCAGVVVVWLLAASVRVARGPQVRGPRQTG
ncbi:MAG: hypothetical protein ACRDTM_08015 [Micromonosporaceae bacterium]